MYEKKQIYRGTKIEEAQYQRLKAQKLNCNNFNFAPSF